MTRTVRSLPKRAVHAPFAVAMAASLCVTLLFLLSVKATGANRERQQLPKNDFNYTATGNGSTGENERGPVLFPAPGPSARIEYPIRATGNSPYARLPDDERCRWLESGPDVWAANDTGTEKKHTDNPRFDATTLDAMFRRIVRIYREDEDLKGRLTVASSPDALPKKVKSDYAKSEDTDADADDDDGFVDGYEDEGYYYDDDDEIVDEDPFDLLEGDGGPWVLWIDNFLTDKESNQLAKLGAMEGYQKSTIFDDDDSYMGGDGAYDYSAEDKEDGTGTKKEAIQESQTAAATNPVPKMGRTSETAWCQSPFCVGDEIYRSVTARIHDLVQIDSSHSESLQLLHYNVGQYYADHHDYYFIEDPTEWSQDGGRILTVFLYLNDVQGGGETSFPRLNLTIAPQKGRAVLWPSVLDSDPRSIDWRTEHAALPVARGEKHGANLWFHLKPIRRKWFRYECDAPRTLGKTYGDVIWFDDDDAMDDEWFDDDDAMVDEIEYKEGKEEL